MSGIRKHRQSHVLLRKLPQATWHQERKCSTGIYGQISYLSYRQWFYSTHRKCQWNWSLQVIRPIKHKPKHCKHSIDLWNLMLKHWTLDLGCRHARGAAVYPPPATSCAKSLFWPILENSCSKLRFIQSSDFPPCACMTTGCCTLLPFSAYLLLFLILKSLLLALCNLDSSPLQILRQILHQHAHRKGKKNNTPSWTLWYIKFWETAISLRVSPWYLVTVPIDIYCAHNIQSHTFKNWM